MTKYFLFMFILAISAKISLAQDLASDMESLVLGTQNLALPVTSKTFDKLDSQFSDFKSNYASDLKKNPLLQKQIHGLESIAKVNRQFSECFGNFIGSRELRQRIQNIMMKEVSFDFQTDCTQLQGIKEPTLDDLTSTLSPVLKNQKLDLMEVGITNDIIKNSFLASLRNQYIVHPEKNIPNSDQLISNVTKEICTENCSQELKSSLKKIGDFEIAKMKKQNTPRYSYTEATEKLKREIKELNVTRKVLGEDIYQQKYFALLHSDLGFLLRYGDLESELGDLKVEEDTSQHSTSFNYQDTVMSMFKFKAGQKDKFEKSLEIKNNVTSDKRQQKRRGNPKGEYSLKKDQLKELLKTDIGAFGRTLLKQPDQAKSVCELIKELEKNEEERKEVLDKTKNASSMAMIGGAICMGVGGVLLFTPLMPVGTIALQSCGAITLAAAGISTTQTGYELYQAHAELDQAIAADLANTGDDQTVIEVANLRGEVSDLTWELGTDAAVSIATGGFLKGASVAYKKFGKDALKNIKTALKNNQTKKQLAKSKEALEKMFPGESDSMIAQILSQNPKYSNEILETIQKLDGDRKAITDLLKKTGPKCS